MENHLFLNLFGYAASALIAISLTMSSLLRLRLINFAGATAFATYGLLIHAYPVAALNSTIVLVNVYHLSRMLQAKTYFRLLPLQPDSDYLKYFLNFYRRDIHRILPAFEYQPAANPVTLFILRDCAPAGVFIAEEKSPGVLHVVLDFVIPTYRDLKIGRFLFVECAGFFRARGIQEIIIAPRTKAFGDYLLEVGFEPINRQQGIFRIWVAKS
jgi:hypothetical protein